MANWSTWRKGQDGEEAAARYLEALGYVILARNLRLPGGEIDILSVESGELVFVEVKRRDGRDFGSGLSAVGRRKRRTLRRIGRDYAQIVAPKSRIRFDIVSIDGNRIAVYRNAF
jgi:putative endonuclease